jgi:hypothetical protein
MQQMASTRFVRLLLVDYILLVFTTAREQWDPVVIVVPD